MQAWRKSLLAVAGGIVALIASQAGAQQSQPDAQSPPAQAPAAQEAAPAPPAPAPAIEGQPATAVQITPPPGLTPSPDAQRPPDPPRPADRRASMEIDAYAIIGGPVRNSEGREIGRVSRLMVDPHDGRISSIMIGIGGTFGFGERQLSVPWSAVKLGEDRQRIVVIVDQRLLDQAPRAQSERRNEPAASPGSPKEK